LGVAIATVIYPLVSRHAARGDLDQLSEDLTLGLRLVWFTALPAGVGIILVAHPLVKLLFERGEFTADDTARAARTIACYGQRRVGLLRAAGAGAGLLRGRQSRGAREIGLVAVALNFVLNVTLIWPLAETAWPCPRPLPPACSGAIGRRVFAHGVCSIVEDMGTTLAKSVIACAIMSLAVTAILRFIVPAAESTRTSRSYSLALAIARRGSLFCDRLGVPG